MRRWLFASALAVLTVASSVAPASAAPPTVRTVGCQESPAQRGGYPNIRLRLGPLAFHGWDGYATWESMDRFRQRGGYAYAKSPMFARAGSIATLYVSPADRENVDIFYGGKRADVIHVRACSRRLSFYSGGLLVRDRSCVEIRVRARGSRRVHRERLSIGVGESCAR